MAEAGKDERVIGLWLDGIGGEPKWIVSRDKWSDGVPSTSTTVKMFDRHEYSRARAEAIELAMQAGLRVLETDEYGRATCIHDGPTDHHTTKEN